MWKIRHSMAGHQPQTTPLIRISAMAFDHSRWSWTVEFPSAQAAKTQGECPNELQNPTKAHPIGGGSNGFCCRAGGKWLLGGATANDEASSAKPIITLIEAPHCSWLAVGRAAPWCEPPAQRRQPLVANWQGGHKHCAAAVAN